MEQELAARLRERQVAEFVHHHEVEPGEMVGDAALPAGAGLGFEPFDEVDHVAMRSNNRLPRPLVSTNEKGEEAMGENKQDPLDVPMDKVITRTDGGHEGAAPKTDSGQTAGADTPRIEGSHTQETVDPAERLPDDPEGQNDLA